MITEQALPHATYFRGKAILPSNVCAHCGKVDDPESRWEQDNDGHRICSDCHALQVAITRFAKRTEAMTAKQANDSEGEQDAD